MMQKTNQIKRRACNCQHKIWSSSRAMCLDNWWCSKNPCYICHTEVITLTGAQTKVAALNELSGNATKMQTS